MLIIDSSTVLVLFLLGVQVTKCLRKYHLSLESVGELSNDCDSWSRSVRQSWAESTRESAGECG